MPLTDRSLILGRLGSHQRGNPQEQEQQDSGNGTHEAVPSSHHWRRHGHFRATLMKVWPPTMNHSVATFLPIGSGLGDGAWTR